MLSHSGIRCPKIRAIGAVPEEARSGKAPASWSESIEPLPDVPRGVFHFRHLRSTWLRLASQHSSRGGSSGARAVKPAAAIFVFAFSLGHGRWGGGDPCKIASVGFDSLVVHQLAAIV
jgi:hypothetical protein